MNLDFSRLLPPFGVGMGKDMHLIHLLIVIGGLFVGHFAFKYLSGNEERLKTFHIIAWIIIGIPFTYFMGSCLAMFLYPFQLEQPNISSEQFAFTSFYFMLFSMGAFTRGIWIHQKTYK